MEFIRELSERGVKLYNSGGQKIVKRYLENDKILNILEFYQESDFSNRPNIIDYGENFILEEYINGKQLIEPIYKENKKIIENIHNLSKEKIGNIELKELLKTQFSKKKNSLNLSEQYLVIIDNFFDDFLQIYENIIIELNWVHGDLSGDNIILNKKGQAYFIDWEWLKKGHYIEDIQKYIQTTLKYNKVQTDDFINNFYKNNNINYKLFLFLESFYFFLNQTLQLSKNRLTIEKFKIQIEEKINSIEKGKIYEIDNLGKKIIVGISTGISDIIEKKEAQQEKPEKIIFSQKMNNQELRLGLNKRLMLKYNDFLVLHGISFKTKNGKNILLGGPSGSGKSFIFEKLKNSGLVKELFDEDLIIYDKNGNLRPLGKKMFKGNIYGNYKYEKNNINNFGKLDGVFFIDNNFSGLENSNFSNENIVQYLIHERYLENDDLVNIFKNFELKNIKAYIIGNNKKGSNFTNLIQTLGEK